MYTDDSVIIAYSINQLQHIMINLFVPESLQNKTNGVLKRKRYETLRIKNNNIEQVSSFKYLGTTIKDRYDTKKRNLIKNRTGQKNFHKHEIFFRTASTWSLKCAWYDAMCSWFYYTNMSRALLTRPYKNVSNSLKCICIYRRILKIPYTQSITHIEVFNRIIKERVFGKSEACNNIDGIW